MHTFTKKQYVRWFLVIGSMVIVGAAIWSLAAPHPLRDTDRAVSMNGPEQMFQAMDNFMFGTFMNPTTSQTGTWQTYQNGPMTIRYRTNGNGFATDFTNPNYEPSMMYGYGYPGAFGGALVTLLFWALIIAGAVMLVKYFMHGPAGTFRSGRANTALDILNERYARGEIDKDEYETKKKDLAS